MGTEVVIAAVGLALSAVGTGYSMYASEQAADEAEDMAEKNAQLEAMESEEMAQRAEEEAAREESLALAAAAASGVGGETTDLYLDKLTATNKREINWIRRSGTSRADMTREAGKNTADSMRSSSYAQAFGDIGGAVGSAADWYTPSSGTKKKPASDYMVI